MRFSLILSLVISLLAVAFALVNNETVMVNIGITSFQGSLALILLVTLFLGVLVGILASLPGRIKAQRRARALEKGQAQRPHEEESSGSEPRQFPPSSERDA